MVGFLTNDIYSMEGTSILVKVDEMYNFLKTVSRGLLVRSSHPDVFCEKDVLRNFAKFTGNHLCQSLFY